MYQELQRLKSRQRETHTLNAPSLYNVDPENFMVSMDKSRMDNAKEFRSQQFEDYCVALGISLTYSVPYEHPQNGLAEVLSKKISSLHALF